MIFIGVIVHGPGGRGNCVSRTWAGLYSTLGLHEPVGTGWLLEAQMHSYLSTSSDLSSCAMQIHLKTVNMAILL